MKKNQQGFTLIELMIVVAIIGILAAIALPQYSQYTSKAKISEVMVLADGAKTAIYDDYAENGVMLAASSILDTAIQAGFNASDFVASITFTRTSDDAVVYDLTLKECGSDCSTKVLGFSFDASGPTFAVNCKAAGPGATDVPEKLLPKACKA